jgi:hypothetical protein
MRRADGWSITRVCFILLLVAAALAFAEPAAAQSSDEGLQSDDQIVLNGRLVVPEGETVGLAVIFNGPAVIEGTVREGVVVFNGRAEISGSVADDVVVFNGDLVVRSGAEVGGDLVSQSTPEIEQGATVSGSTESVATRFDFEGFGFASRFVWWIGYSISSLVLGLVLLLLFPGLDPSAITAWRERTGESIGWGVGVFFLVPLAAILLLITVVALPLGLFVMLGLALVYTVGYVVGAAVLGRLVVRPPTSRFLAFLVGWLIARAFALIPVVGGLAWLLASVVGLGVLFVVARRRGEAPSTSAVGPPPPPVPA